MKFKACASSAIHNILQVLLEPNLEVIDSRHSQDKSVEMRRIVKLCELTLIPYRTLPSLSDLERGDSLTTLREVSVEDLLSRDPIQFNPDKLQEVIGDKIILITGAGGSIGSQLSLKLAACQPQMLILIEHSEFNLFQIHNELQQKFPAQQLQLHLISITQAEMINEIMRNSKPHYVFHAAAYKHVPMLEKQIKIAIDNNVFGTQTVALAAQRHGVKKLLVKQIKQ